MPGVSSPREVTMEARAPRAWGQFGACCTPLLHLGDAPLGSAAPASARSKSMDDRGHDGAGRKAAVAAPPIASRHTLAVFGYARNFPRTFFEKRISYAWSTK